MSTEHLHSHPLDTELLNAFFDEFKRPNIPKYAVIYSQIEDGVKQAEIISEMNCSYGTIQRAKDFQLDTAYYLCVGDKDQQNKPWLNLPSKKKAESVAFYAARWVYTARSQGKDKVFFSDFTMKWIQTYMEKKTKSSPRATKSPRKATKKIPTQKTNQTTLVQIHKKPMKKRNIPQNYRLLLGMATMLGLNTYDSTKRKMKTKQQLKNEITNFVQNC